MTRRLHVHVLATSSTDFGDVFLGELEYTTLELSNGWLQRPGVVLPPPLTSEGQGRDSK